MAYVAAHHCTVELAQRVQAGHCIPGLSPGVAKMMDVIVCNRVRVCCLRREVPVRSAKTIVRVRESNSDCSNGFGVNTDVDGTHQDQPRETAVYEKYDSSQCSIVTAEVFVCTNMAVPAAKTHPPSVSSESAMETLWTALGLFGFL